MKLSDLELTNINTLDVEENYDVFYNYSPDMLLSVDPKTHCVIQCNQTLCETTGFLKEEVVGMNIFDLYHVDSHEAVKKAFLEFLEVGVVKNANLIVRKKNGKKLYILLSVIAIRDDNNDIIYSNSCWRDVTHIKVLEDSLKETNKKLNQKVKELGNKNKELEQFAYVVSHDLKTPLRNIDGMLSIIKSECKGVVDSKWECYFTYITESAGRMGRLIDTVLEFSQIGIKSKKEEIDTDLIIDNVLDDFKLSIEDKKVQIFRSKLPKLSGYAIEFHMLMQNLIGNAIKFHRENTNSIIKISCDEERDQYCFTVKDNGIGINKDNHQKIFSIFNRISEQYKGTGIGLAQCKKIVKLHGGVIWIEENEQFGSTFNFTIPKELN
ncbi:PAS domain-containing sensor histidine kinase [Flammeovirga pectinis]|uniref:histidine kinase n=1 Tax=Flammeovirga pectinis TaxID=2494373 RepID=A0A3Q9FJY9_9BACT|nr:ATP-binding protein [Flammeovirga pectinis]AZQ61469.1 PAS domain-containing sensor histidine kinase [Flammeovirga pectinis]